MAAGHGLQELRDFAKGCQDLQLVCFGIPRSSARRAREDHDQQGLPRPVGSPEEPWRTTNRQLSPVEAEKVAAANAFYVKALLVIGDCFERNSVVMGELPPNGLLWHAEECAKLLVRESALSQSMMLCVVGGVVKKARKLRGAAIAVRRVLAGKKCDPTRLRQPGRTGLHLQTADRAEYPAQLCELIASCYRRKLCDSRAEGLGSSAMAAARARGFVQRATKVGAGA